MGWRAGWLVDGVGCGVWERRRRIGGRKAGTHLTGGARTVRQGCSSPRRPDATCSVTPITAIHGQPQPFCKGIIHRGHGRRNVTAVQSAPRKRSQRRTRPPAASGSSFKIPVHAPSVSRASTVAPPHYTPDDPPHASLFRVPTPCSRSQARTPPRPGPLRSNHESVWFDSAQHSRDGPWA